MYNADVTLKKSITVMVMAPVLKSSGITASVPKKLRQQDFPDNAYLGAGQMSLEIVSNIDGCQENKVLNLSVIGIHELKNMTVAGLVTLTNTFMAFSEKAVITIHKPYHPESGRIKDSGDLGNKSCSARRQTGV